MAQRYAVIVDGTVTNLILWDGVSIWTPPDGATIVPVSGRVVDIGYTFDGTTFSAPNK